MLILVYCAGALITALLLFIVFLLDKSTPLSCYRSWLLLAIASITWPISVPLAGLERWRDRYSAPVVLGVYPEEAVQPPEPDVTLDSQSSVTNRP